MAGVAVNLHGTALGPCRCMGCGQAVYWARGLTRLEGQIVPGFLTWRDETGGKHRCARRTLTPTVMPSSKRRSGSGLVTRPRPAA